MVRTGGPTARERTPAPVELLGDAGAPPNSEPPWPTTVDEGPMRRDLLRQIRWLERDYAAAAAERFMLAPPSASRCRGPAILSAGQLEQIRDELLDAIASLDRGDTGRA